MFMNSLKVWDREGVDEILTAHVYRAITNHKLRIPYVEAEGGWLEIREWEWQYFGYKGCWKG
jgi:hypothetical protein